MCTYENWPKSIKCAMCGTNNNSQRSQASSLIMPSPDRIPEPDINQDDRYKDYILGMQITFFIIYGLIDFSVFQILFSCIYHYAEHT